MGHSRGRLREKKKENPWQPEEKRHVSNKSDEKFTVPRKGTTKKKKKQTSENNTVEEKERRKKSMYPLF